MGWVGRIRSARSQLLAALERRKALTVILPTFLVRPVARSDRRSKMGESPEQFAEPERFLDQGRRTEVEELLFGVLPRISAHETARDFRVEGAERGQSRSTLSAAG